MSELAFNMNGDPFEVPETATGWRVRKMKPKGAPEVVYGRDGLPLVLPIEAELDDLRHESSGAPGRYRLDPVDEANKPVVGATCGYVFVHAETHATETAIAASPLPPASDNVAIEAMRMNAEMARSVIDRFPQMMEAAAVLLRAADGAGIPARISSAIINGGEIDGEDGDDMTGVPAGFDLNAIVGQVVTALVGSIASGSFKVPGVGALLDWRKAAPAQVEPPQLSAPAQPKTKPAKVKIPVVEKETALPPLEPAMLGHFAAVQAALSPEDRALAQEVAKDLGPAELRAWFDELSKLSVSDAAARIRTVIHANTAGDVS